MKCQRLWDVVGRKEKHPENQTPDTHQPLTFKAETSALLGAKSMVGSSLGPSRTKGRCQAEDSG